MVTKTTEKTKISKKEHKKKSGEGAKLSKKTKASASAVKSDKKNIIKKKKIMMSKVYPRASLKRFALETFKNKNIPVTKISSKAITEMGNIFAKDTLKNLVKSYTARRKGVQWVTFDLNKKNNEAKDAMRIIYTTNF